MATSTKRLIDGMAKAAGKVASANLETQQEMMRHWAHTWPMMVGARGGDHRQQSQLPFQWADFMASLARAQYGVLDSQFRATVDTWGVMAEVALESVEAEAAPPKEPTKVVAQAAAAPVSAPPAVMPEEAKVSPEVSTQTQDLRTKNIRDKVAIVTGGGSGIGEAVAYELSRRGARTVVLVDRSDRVCELAEVINKKHDRAVADPRVGDVTDEAFRVQVFDEIRQQHGIASICVPAAGITRDDLAVRVDRETGKAHVYAIEQFRQVVEVNLLAPIYWAMEMVARIAEDRRQRGLKRWEPTEGIQGAVIFLGSVSSQGNKGQISYATTKAGLEGAGATLMKEAIFHGVRCGIIHPGFTDTPMARALGEDFLNKYVLPFTQLRRLIRSEEIADAICFMISNSAVSGELWADAGWHPPA